MAHLELLYRCAVADALSIVHVENHTLIGMRPTSPDDAPNPGVCIYIYVYHFQYSVSQNSGVDVVAAGSKLVAKETN